MLLFIASVRQLLMGRAMATKRPATYYRLYIVWVVPRHFLMHVEVLQFWSIPSSAVLALPAQLFKLLCLKMCLLVWFTSIHQEIHACCDKTVYCIYCNLVWLKSCLHSVLWRALFWKCVGAFLFSRLRWFSLFPASWLFIYSDTCLCQGSRVSKLHVIIGVTCSGVHVRHRKGSELASTCHGRN